MHRHHDGQLAWLMSRLVKSLTGPSAGPAHTRIPGRMHPAWLLVTVVTLATRMTWNQVDISTGLGLQDSSAHSWQWLRLLLTQLSPPPPLPAAATALLPVLLAPLQLPPPLRVVRRVCRLGGAQAKRRGGARSAFGTL